MCVHVRVPTRVVCTRACVCECAARAYARTCVCAGAGMRACACVRACVCTGVLREFTRACTFALASKWSAREHASTGKNARMWGIIRALGLGLGAGLVAGGRGQAGGFEQVLWLWPGLQAIQGGFGARGSTGVGHDGGWYI